MSTAVHVVKQPRTVAPTPQEQLLLEYERNAAAFQPILAAPPLPLIRGAQAAGDSTAGAGGSGEGGEGAAGEGEGGEDAVVTADPNEAGRYCEHVRAGTPLLAHGMCR